MSSNAKNQTTAPEDYIHDKQKARSGQDFASKKQIHKTWTIDNHKDSGSGNKP